MSWAVLLDAPSQSSESDEFEGNGTAIPYTVNITRHGYFYRRLTISAPDTPNLKAGEWLYRNVETVDDERGMFLDLATARFSSKSPKAMTVDVESRTIYQLERVYHVRIDAFENGYRKVESCYSLPIERLSSRKQLFEALSKRSGKYPSEFRRVCTLANVELDEDLSDTDLEECPFFVVELDSLTAMYAACNLEQDRRKFHEKKGETTCEVICFMRAGHGSYDSLKTHKLVLKMHPHKVVDDLIQFVSQKLPYNVDQLKLARIDRIENGVRELKPSLVRALGYSCPAFHLYFVLRKSRTSKQIINLTVYSQLSDEPVDTTTFAYYGPTDVRASVKLFEEYRIKDIDYGTACYAEDSLDKINVHRLTVGKGKVIYHLQLTCNQKPTRLFNEPDSLWHHYFHHEVYISLVCPPLETVEDLLKILKKNYGYDPLDISQVSDCELIDDINISMKTTDKLKPYGFYRLIILSCKCNFWLLKE